MLDETRLLVGGTRYETQAVARTQFEAELLTAPHDHLPIDNGQLVEAYYRIPAIATVTEWLVDELEAHHENLWTRRNDA